MKKVLMFLFALLTTVVSWAKYLPMEDLIYHEEDGGYYEVANVGDLWVVYTYYNYDVLEGQSDPNLVFKMTQDIDMTGYNGFLPIASINSDRYFDATFDGNGHTISNLTIMYDRPYIGLFAQLSSSATVKNLNLSNCEIRYNNTFDSSVGGIAGRNYGTIENCTVTGIVSNYGNHYNVGGIVGENLGTGKVINCTCVAGHPATGILYSSTNPGTATGCHAYYRISTESAVSMSISPAPLTVAGISCYNEGTALNVAVTPNDDTQMLTDVTFTNTTATRTAYGLYALTMTARDVDVTASLAPKITVTSAEGGSVTPSTYSPAIGGTVTLTIATNTGYTFQSPVVTTSDGQIVSLSGSGNTRIFTMPDQPVTINPVFNQVEYTISGLGSVAGGSIGGPSTAHYGDQVTLTVTPIAGYSLQSLNVITSGGQNVGVNGSGNTRTFTMPAQNVNVAATFASSLSVHITTYNCTATAEPNPCVVGQTVTITITPDNGATLQKVEVLDNNHHSVVVSGSGNTRTFIMPASDAYVTVSCSISGQLTGKGTQAEPYLIYNETDLRLLSGLSKSNYFSNKYIRLVDDITMSDTPMAPIGHTTAGYFYGNFDGNGHTISNLHISDKIGASMSLFGHVKNSSISNLTLANCTITCDDGQAQYVGAIVGYLNNGTISNCHVVGGSINVNAPLVFDTGGIVGYANGTVIDCSNSASISQTVNVSYARCLGGIAGYISSGTIKRCTNSGPVSVIGTSDVALSMGGIVGRTNKAIVANCANTGSVSTTVTGTTNENMAGGVVGNIETQEAAVVGCTNSGTVIASGGRANYAGAIEGAHLNGGPLKNNYYFGDCNVLGTSSFISSGDGPQFDVTENYGALRGYAIIKPDMVTLAGIEGYDGVLHPAYAAEGETVSFTVTPGEGYVGGIVKYNDGTDHVLTATGGVYSFTMPAKAVTITVAATMDPSHFALTGTNEYTIKTATGWNLFCDALQDNNAYNRFSGKTVKLANDISVTRAAGSQGHEFMGTFEGNNRTLAVTLDDVSTQGTAPFREISGATIKRLNVTGSVNGTTHAAGLVGFARGNASVINTIEDCKVAADVTVTTPNSSGNYHCGGIVGHAVKSTLNISNSIYSGTIINSDHYAGGLQGWSDGNTLNISNCLFSGNYAGNGFFHPIAVRARNAAMSGTIEGAYYTLAPTLANANFLVTAGEFVYLEPQSFPCNSVTILDVTVYCPVDLTPFGKTDNYMPDGTAQYPYLISNVDSWNYLCDCLDDISTWNSFKGKTVKLANNITVTRMAGGSNSPFKGTFDGGNHTLTLNYDGSGDFVAPFPNVSDSVTFSDLTISGTVTSTGGYAAGLVGHLFGTVTVDRCKSNVEITAGSGSGGFVGLCEHSVSFTNCVSSAVIHCSVGNNSGFVGWSRSSVWNIDFEGCVFNGKLLKSSDNTGSNGGFIGWKGDNKIVNITNCLYAPAALNEGEAYADGNSATFCREHAAYASTIKNCYYTKKFGTAQGKQAHSITGDEDVTVAASAGGTAYNLSGITAYGTGLMRDSVLYAGENDVMALTLGYTGDESISGFTASAGTLTGTENPFTLTMPNEDVVISAITAMPGVPGDVNGDGSVTTVDVTCIYNYLLNGDQTFIDTCDVNGDGYITTVDITVIYNIMLGSKK